MVGARTRTIEAALILALSSAGASSWSAAQDSPTTQSPLQRAVSECIKAERYDDVIALLKNAAAEPTPPADAPQVLFSTTFYFPANETYANKVLDLFQLIIERFPDSPIVPYAWCGMGQAYGKLGDKEKMIAALERGVSLPRDPLPEPFFDTSGFACETLGNHYMANRQWEKALKAYTEWKPDSWCGTCFAAMESSRTDHILVCLIHLGRHQEAIDLAWSAIAAGSSMERLPEFMLLRLYDEAGQRDDLSQLVRDLIVAAKIVPPGLNEDGAAAQQEKAQRLEKTAARMNTVMELIGETNWKKRLDAFHETHLDEGWGPPLEKHVASWLMIREPAKSIPLIVAAAKADEDKIVPLGAILAAIDSPAARNGLITLAVLGKGIGHQQEICGLIRARVREPDALIAQIQSRVPEQRKRHIYAAVDPAPLSQSFFTSWPPPKKGSLSKNLPKNLIGGAAPK